MPDPVEHCRLAQSARRQRDFASALAHYDRAAVLYREADNPVRLAHTIRHAGDVLYESGRTALADTRFREALDLYRQHPEAPPLDLANALRSLAVLKADHASPTPPLVAEARSLWQEARALYALLAIPDGIAECDVRLAQLPPAAQEAPPASGSLANE